MRSPSRLPWERTIGVLRRPACESSDSLHSSDAVSSDHLPQSGFAVPRAASLHDHSCPSHTAEDGPSGLAPPGPPMPASLPADRASLSSNDHLHYGVVVSYLTTSFFRSLLEAALRVGVVMVLLVLDGEAIFVDITPLRLKQMSRRSTLKFCRSKARHSLPPGRASWLASQSPTRPISQALRQLGSC